MWTTNRKLFSWSATLVPQILSTHIQLMYYMSLKLQSISGVIWKDHLRSFYSNWLFPSSLQCVMKIRNVWCCVEPSSWYGTWQRKPEKSIYWINIRLRRRNTIWFGKCVHISQGNSALCAEKCAKNLIVNTIPNIK